MKPRLIDELVHMRDTQECIQGKWAIAKPYPYPGFFYQLKIRIYHAWLILIGKAQAFQYVRDRVKNG